MTDGIKLTFDDAGDADVLTDEESSECLIDGCEHALPDYVCGFDNESVWNHYRISGYCPLMKWYRDTKVKEYCREERRCLSGSGGASTATGKNS